MQSEAREWVRDMPHVTTARNVGGGKKNKWTPEEDALLEATVRELGLDNWRLVAAKLVGRTGKQCRERWLGHLDPGNVKVTWSPEEDMALVQKQGAYGNRWVKIAEELPGRSVIAVKNRWAWLCRRGIPGHADEFRKLVNDVVSHDPPLDAPFVDGYFWQDWGDVGFPLFSEVYDPLE